MANILLKNELYFIICIEDCMSAKQRNKPISGGIHFSWNSNIALWLEKINKISILKYVCSYCQIDF